MERRDRNGGYSATVCGATPALLEQRDQVCGTRPQHDGVGLVAQRCKQARLDLEATQAVNQQDASTPQHLSQPKIASDWISEQQHAPNIIEDTPDIGGVGQTTQHVRRASSPPLQWQWTHQQTKRVLSTWLSLTLTGQHQK